MSFDMTGIIINPDRKTMIGIVFTGSESDFARLGIRSNNVVRTEKGLALFTGIAGAEKLIKESKSFGFNDKTNSIIVEDKQIRDLKMYSARSKDEMPMEVPNGLMIVKRIVDNDTDMNIKGFIVEFAMDGGKQYRLKYEDVIAKAKLFNPLNFVVRTNKKSGKKYIATKGSVSRMADMPYEALSKIAKKKDGETKTDAPKKEPTEAPNVGYVDFFALMAKLKENECKIIYLPNDRYSRTTENLEETDEAFRAMGVGEIAEPVVEHSEDKLKVNLKFRKAGIVTVKGLNIQTFSYADKAVYVNEEPHIKNIGVAVPGDRYDDLISYIEASGKRVAVGRLEDEGIKKAVSALYNRPDYVYLTIQIDGFDIMDAKRIDYMMQSACASIGRLRKYCYNLECLKIMKKFVKASIKDVESLSRKEIRDEYKSFSVEMMQSIEDAGIDLASGSFNKYVKAAKPVKVEDNALFIKFGFVGAALEKLTAGALAKSGADEEIMKRMGKIDTAAAEKLVESVNAIKEAQRQRDMARLKEISNMADSELNRLKRRIWMYKYSVIAKGKFASISDICGNWEETKAKADANVFICTDEGCGDFKMEVTKKLNM